MISSNRLYDPILESLFKDFPDKQNEMIKWISNYSAEKTKMPTSPNHKDNSRPDEWRKKRNSVFVSEINDHNKISYLETLIPIEVFIINLKQLIFFLKVSKLFEKVNDLEFDCFKCAEISSNNQLSYLMLHLFYQNDLFEKLNIDPKVFYKFVKKIQEGLLLILF